MKYFETRRRFNEAISEMRNSFRSDMGRSRDLMPYLEGSFEDMYAEFESMATGSPDQAGQTETLRESQESGLAEIEALAERLDELLGGSPSGLSEEALQQLSALGDRQNQLGQDTGEFERKLGDALKKLPFLSPATPEMAGQAGKSMKKASDQLQGGDKPGAMGSESRALEGLSGIAKEFRQARKKMQSSMSGQSGFRMVGRPGGHGSQGQEVDRSRVEIPEEMEARELKGFREDVLKAMRDGRYPKDYEKDVETYYEKLIK